MTTKIQQLREKRYRDQLRRCGFRSWKAANTSRCWLIEEASYFNQEPNAELSELQKLADLYVCWKTNDQLGRSTRRAERMLARLEDVK